MRYTYTHIYIYTYILHIIYICNVCVYIYVYVISYQSNRRSWFLCFKVPQLFPSRSKETPHTFPQTSHWSASVNILFPLSSCGTHPPQVSEEPLGKAQKTSWPTLNVVSRMPKCLSGPRWAGAVVERRDFSALWAVGRKQRPYQPQHLPPPPPLAQPLALRP